ncbi:hypothetical protein [Lysobacter sp. CA199]|uniref:hypothetical protein n=1 Tax=Lysobacter sp. CA199 TaxID=3455608 RepID=UPI003F8D4C8B
MPALKFDLLATRLAPLVCIVAACACASTAGSLSAKENTTMTESLPNASDETLSAQELNRKILAWVLSVRDARDLSGPSIEAHTGLSLKIDAGNPNSFRGVGALAEGWRYSLYSVKNVPGPSPHAVMFSMGHTTPDYADMTPVCVGLEHYQSALIAAGFKPSQTPPRLGTEYRFFRTDKVSARIDLNGKTKRYDEHLCVSRVFVTAAAPQG